MEPDRNQPTDSVRVAACLVNSAGEELPLTTDVITCGRSPDNGLVLDDESVSRRHARLERTPGGYALSDLGSRNGTFVNGEDVGRGPSRLLRDGDQLRFGNHRFTYRASGQPSVAPPEPTRAGPGVSQERRTEQLFAVIPYVKEANGIHYSMIQARGVLNAATIDGLLDACRRSVEQQVMYLVIDAARVDYIDSTGIGGLVRLQRELQTIGGEVRLVAPSTAVRQTVELLNLATLLTMYPDEAAAVMTLHTPVETAQAEITGPPSRRPEHSLTPQLILPSGEAWPLVGGTVSIGREVGNDIFLDHPEVADYHAKIVHDEGHFVVVDLRQSSGTFVNGERVRDLRLLHDGDFIDLGPHRFEFYEATTANTPGGVGTNGTGAQPAEVSGAYGVLLFKERPLVDRELTIGRAPENGVVLEDSRVSGEHAKIVHEGGDYWLVDLRSSNGTFVNDQRVPDVRRLRNGDLISIGATMLTFETRTMRLEQEAVAVEAPRGFVFADSSGKRWIGIRIVAAIAAVVLTIAVIVFLRFITQ